MTSQRIELQRACGDLYSPDDAKLREWAGAALDYCDAKGGSVTLRLVGNAEIRALNHTYRHLDASTNVLSFPFVDPPGVESGILGDIVICCDIVADEAQQQCKGIDEHWAHMVIHGVLHLCGHDHQQALEAEKMEAIERSLMSSFGYPDPYHDQSMERVGGA